MRNKLLVMFSAVAFLLASCTVERTYQLTGAPIGTKTGVSKSSIIGDSDFSISTAAKNGKITKIGAVEITTKVFIFPKVITKVYGE